MSYWLAIGPPDNWEIGIKKKIWGVTPRHSKAWGLVEQGDTVFFYAMTPVKGLIGYGTVAKTKVDEKPFWPQEISEKQSYWPFRISFHERKQSRVRSGKQPGSQLAVKASFSSAPSNLSTKSVLETGKIRSIRRSLTSRCLLRRLSALYGDFTLRVGLFRESAKAGRLDASVSLSARSKNILYWPS